MIIFRKHILNNGLTLLLHQDSASPFVVYNTLYKVGARNESADSTGLAHFFEHLMFGGSRHAPDYDAALYKASGDNNAFTSSDLTNYYITLPNNNLETCMWLESDRMANLNLTKKSIAVQRKVVIEEFKEGYINQPYGDAMHLLFDLCYEKHPYKYPVIGKELAHIEHVTKSILKDFYKKYYAPNNAIVTIGGNFDFDKTIALVEKYYNDIPPTELNAWWSEEPKHDAKKTCYHPANVPTKAIYKAWNCCARLDTNYYAMDLITDILGNGKSSRLYQNLVLEQHIFSEIDCYHNGSVDAGVLIIEAKLNPTIEFDIAEKAIDNVLKTLTQEGLQQNELQRYINKSEVQIELNKMQLLNRIIDLSFFEMLGDANAINLETQKYAHVNEQQIIHYANEIFVDTNASVVYYG